MKRIMDETKQNKDPKTARNQERMGFETNETIGASNIGTIT